MLWPISPAMPCTPVNRRSLSTMPAPTPAPQVTKISESCASPSQNSYSLRAAVSASFCTCTATGGTPAWSSAWVIRGTKSTLRQPRLGAKRSMPLASSKAPGKPTPTPWSCTPCPASCAWVCATKPAAWRHTASGSLPASGSSNEHNTSPMSDTPTTRSASTATSTPIMPRRLPSMRSGVDGRPSPWAAGTSPSVTQPSSISSRTSRLTVDLVRPLSCASWARERPLWRRSRRSKTLRLMRLTSC
ncbi:hypothetical protein FQZ97_767560 [compost metagenome]